METRIFENAEEIAVAAAELYKELINNKPNAVLGLATGSSPISTYKNLIKKYENGDLDFSRCYAANLDEYVGLTKDNDQSYAYFMYEKDKILSEVAEKRLKAIKEFTEFGSGFKIAMRDLEIRGAGSLLRRNSISCVCVIFFIRFTSVVCFFLYFNLITILGFCQIFFEML